MPKVWVQGTGRENDPLFQGGRGRPDHVLEIDAGGGGSDVLGRGAQFDGHRPLAVGVGLEHRRLDGELEQQFGLEPKLPVVHEEAEQLAGEIARVEAGFGRIAELLHPIPDPPVTGGELAGSQVDAAAAQTAGDGDAGRALVLEHPVDEGGVGFGERIGQRFRGGVMHGGQQSARRAAERRRPR